MEIGGLSITETWGNVSKEGDMKYDNGKKPIRLISDLIQSVCEEDDIILDFFAGSSTTAHATMNYNSFDSNNTSLKYIMVQIPESIPKKDPHFKEGF